MVEYTCSRLYLRTFICHASMYYASLICPWPGASSPPRRHGAYLISVPLGAYGALTVKPVTLYTTSPIIANPSVRLDPLRRLAHIILLAFDGDIYAGSRWLSSRRFFTSRWQEVQGLQRPSPCRAMLLLAAWFCFPQPTLVGGIFVLQGPILLALA